MCMCMCMCTCTWCMIDDTMRTRAYPWGYMYAYVSLTHNIHHPWIYGPQGWGANELALGWVSRRRHATPALPSHVSFSTNWDGLFPAVPFYRPQKRSIPQLLVQKTQIFYLVNNLNLSRFISSIRLLGASRIDPPEDSVRAKEFLKSALLATPSLQHRRAWSVRLLREDLS